jgi:hypothetical protein
VLQENSSVVRKMHPFLLGSRVLFQKLSLGLHPSFLTCLGLVDSPGEEAPLGNRLFGLVVRLAAEETAATEEWEPLVESCKAQWEETWSSTISPLKSSGDFKSRKDWMHALADSTKNVPSPSCESMQ